MFNKGTNKKEVQSSVEGGDPKAVKPKYFNVQGILQFGFEIGHPAYPAYDDSWKKMIALEPDVNGLLNGIGGGLDGIIVWEMFKPVSGTHSNEASVEFVFNEACKFYNLGSNYDCNSAYPMTAAPTSFEKLFLQ